MEVNSVSGSQSCVCPGLLLEPGGAYFFLPPQKSHGRIAVAMFPWAWSATVFSRVCSYVYLVVVRISCCNRENQHLSDLKNNTVYLSFTKWFWIEQSRLAANCIHYSYSGSHVFPNGLLHLHLWCCCMSLVKFTSSKVLAGGKKKKEDRERWREKA